MGVPGIDGEPLHCMACDCLGHGTDDRLDARNCVYALPIVLHKGMLITQTCVIVKMLSLNTCNLISADPSDHAVYRVGLWPLACEVAGSNPAGRKDICVVCCK
jgi:hypothetical protein